MCVNIIYVCICLYCVICLILYYRSLLICTNKEFMNTESDSHYNSLVYTTSNILTGLQTLKPQLCEAVPVIFFSPVVW